MWSFIRDARNAPELNCHLEDDIYYISTVQTKFPLFNYISNIHFNLIILRCMVYLYSFAPLVGVFNYNYNKAVSWVGGARTSYVQLPKLATFVQRFLPFLATFSIHIRTTLVQILPILAII